MRGGLVDLFPASVETPLRFDFFGKQLEIDPHLRSGHASAPPATLKRIALAPMSEVLLNDETIKRFRARYTATFGGNTVDDPLYGAISAGQRFPGIEHWLPFFYEHLDRLADYTGDAPFVFDDQAREAFADRQTQIEDYYEAREQARTAQEAGGGGRALQAVPAGPALRGRRPSLSRSARRR